MKFKEGDKVKVRSLEAMKREFGLGEYDEPNTSLEFSPQMERFCGQEVTIAEVYTKFYKIEEDLMYNKWNDEMLEVDLKFGGVVEVSYNEEG